MRVGASFEIDKLVAQTDQLLHDVVEIMEDDRESEFVKRLLRFRDAISKQVSADELTLEAEAARAEVLGRPDRPALQGR